MPGSASIIDRQLKGQIESKKMFFIDVFRKDDLI